MTKRIAMHWQRVADMPCLICGNPYVQIAHAHGPSLRMRDHRMLKPKGKKMAWMDWLVLPLCERDHFHYDNALRSWEATHGTSAMWLDLMCERLGYDVWELSRAEMKPTLETA